MTQIREYNKAVIALYNKDDSLDLRAKRKEIENTLYEIKFKRNGLVKYEIVDISQHEITLNFKENSNEWHKDFGKILVEKHSMRRFCKEGEKYKMFNFPKG